LRARLTVYPDAGHAVHWDEPSRFAADLVGFVRSLADQPARQVSKFRSTEQGRLFS
jgi:hypothetical protein